MKRRDSFRRNSSLRAAEIVVKDPRDCKEAF